MTAKKISVSLPPDVVTYLEGQGNVSGTIADAVRAQMAAGRVEQLLAQAGIVVTEAGRARWRERLATPMPAEVLAAGRRRLDAPA